MKHTQKALAFSLSMIVMNGLYALCDTTDDEFYKKSWAIKTYAWLFEHSIDPLDRLLLFPVIYAHHKLPEIDYATVSDWVYYASLAIIPAFFLASLAIWIGVGYCVSRWAGRVFNVLFAGVYFGFPAIGLALFAVDASIPSTEWTFQVDHSDGAGWAQKFPDKMACERELRAWQENANTLSAQDRPRSHDFAKCVSPSD